MRALAPEIQKGFVRLERRDLLGMRQWMDRSGLSAFLLEAAAPPRGPLLFGHHRADARRGTQELAQHQARLAAALLSLGRAGRTPSCVLDWILGQTFLWMETEVRRTAGPGLDRGIERHLQGRGLVADRLSTRAMAAATVASAIDRAERFDPGSPLLPWLLGIARNIVRDAARAEGGSFSLPRVSVDPDSIGKGVEPALDDRDQREWIEHAAFAGACAPPWAPAIVAHVLGDSPFSASELAGRLDIGLPRFYKRVTEVRARLRTVMDRRS